MTRYRAICDRLIAISERLKVASQNFSRKRRKRQVCKGLSFECLEPRKVLSADLPSFSPDLGILYQIHGVNGDQGQLSEIDLIDQSFFDVGENTGFKINGTGFRVEDGYIYGIKMDRDHLIRMGSDGSYEVIGEIDQLPPGSYYTGDFGEDGLLYLRHRNNYYGVNVDTSAVVRVLTASENVTKTYDIAYNPTTGLHYSIRKVGSRSEFISVDLRGDSDTAQVTVINNNLKPSGTYGAMFSDASGRVFAANNSGGLYEIDLESGVATYAGHSPRASSNDGSVSSQAFINLPPVAIDSWMSLLAGESARSIPIEAPYDLEEQPLEIRLLSLPEVGVTRLPDGSVASEQQTLSIEQLTQLTYQPPSEVELDATTLVYEVSDGHHVVEANVQINFAGLSQISGSVVVLDDTEESSFEGYIYNNEVRITGDDFRGNAVDKTVLTDVNGQFVFEELAPGTYQIEQVQPPVVYDAWASSGELSGDIFENRIENIVIDETPDSLEGVTFFEHAPVSISGFVYVDEDGSGEVDVSESGVSNVAVRIQGTDMDGNSVDESITTDSYGFYEFRRLAPGTFSVTQTQPEFYVSASTNVGELGGVADGDTIADIELGAGQQALEYSFGEYEMASLTGAVFIDNDIDKNFDQGDTALESVVVQLNGTDFLGNPVSLETLTDVNGQYVFNHLLSGTYNLTEIQPEGLEEGYSHVGIFNQDETVEDTNGVAGVNQITGIEVGFGRHGRGYSFSERVGYRFATQFDATALFFGTDSDDQFEFNAGDDFHRVVLNGEEFELDATVTTHVLFDGKEGEDQVTIVGSDRVEQAVTTGNTAVMRSELWRVKSINGEHFVVDSGGGYDRAFMYDTELDDRVKMTQDYTRLWNDNAVIETRGFHRTYAYAHHGGEDRAYLYDSKYDDTVKMTRDSGRMIGRKFYSFAGKFERVYAVAQNGGNDRAQFWDTTMDNDIFHGTPEYSRMYNTGYYNYAKGFQLVESFAYSGGVNDRAYLYGTDGDEILISSPAKTGMTGDSLRYDAYRFERTYAFGEGGLDRAYLFDSKQDDRVVARPDNVQLYNNHYFLNALDFAQVDAYSSKGGNDRAYFYDSEGVDTIITLESETRMFGEGFDNTSHGFARTYVHSTAGGDDLAFLYDTDQADTIKVGESVSKMYGETYYTWLNQVEVVEAKFANANRHDRALVFGAVSEQTLALTGDLASLIYDHAAEFVYDVDSDHGDSDDDDPDLVSLFEDLEDIVDEKY